MNTNFQRTMAEATRLTRAGDLQRAAALLRGALGTPGAMPPTMPQPAARPAAPAGELAAGSHTGSAGTREYKLFVPSGHEGRALPLVVMLHGCQQNPDDFAAGTRMHHAAEQRDVFVLYPAQAADANPQRCWNWFKHNHQQRGRGEPALLAGMVRELMAAHAIDPQRVYVAGLSAGGAMAAILGAAYPDLFAAIGVHSGLPAGAARDLPSALQAMQQGGAAAAGPMPPTIVFHGDRDSVVHPLNGEQAFRAGAGPATLESEQAGLANGRKFTRRTQADVQGRVVAEHWLLHGAGHAWSGGHAPGSYTDGSGPDASAEMLRFFGAHRLAHPQPVG